MRRISITSLLILTTLHFLTFACQGQETNQGFKAELTVELKRQSFGEVGEITGTIRFRLLAPGGWPVAEKPTIVLNGPQVNLVFDMEFSALPTGMEFERPLVNPVRIGQLYEIPFKVGMNVEIKRLLPKDRSFPAFSLGKHFVQAEVHSRRWMSWTSPPNNQSPELVASFTSAQQTFSVEASGCDELKRQDILKSIDAADDDWKLNLASFFLLRGKLGPDDLLPVMDAVRLETKGRLAQLYAAQGGAFKKLKFFGRPTGQVILDQHTNAPFFLRVAPKEEVRFVYAGPATVNHNVNGLEQNYTTLAKPEKVTRAPAQPGLYKMVCDIHSIPWGWVLVVDAEGGPNDNNKAR